MKRRRDWRSTAPTKSPRRKAWLAAAPLDRRPQPAGHPADGAGHHQFRDRAGHERLRRRLGDAGDGGAGTFPALRPGNQGRQRRGQAQGDDQRHRHGRARRPAEGNSAATNSCPATS